MGSPIINLFNEAVRLLPLADRKDMRNVVIKTTAENKDAYIKALEARTVGLKLRKGWTTTITFMGASIVVDDSIEFGAKASLKEKTNDLGN